MNETRTVPIDSIIVGDRYRKDQGGLVDLAASIKEVGLLHPPVVTPDNRLVAGGRRLAALKDLGWAEVPVTVVDGLNDVVRLLIAERDENTCRKEFTPSEAVALADRLKALEKEAAERRKREGRSKGGKARKKSSGENCPQPQPAPVDTEVQPEAPSPAPTDAPQEDKPEENGRVRDKLAAAVGMSGRQLEKAEVVVEAAAADPETFGPVVAEMDATGKVEPAYQKVINTPSTYTAWKPSISRLVRELQDLVNAGQLGTDDAKMVAKLRQEEQHQLAEKGKDAIDDYVSLVRLERSSKRLWEQVRDAADRADSFLRAIDGCDAWLQQADPVVRKKIFGRLRAALKLHAKCFASLELAHNIFESAVKAFEEALDLP